MERTGRGSDLRCLKGKTKQIFANILNNNNNNNNNIIQSLLNIRKIKLQLFINVVYRDQKYTL